MIPNEQKNPNSNRNGWLWFILAIVIATLLLIFAEKADFHKKMRDTSGKVYKKNINLNN